MRKKVKAALCILLLLILTVPNVYAEVKGDADGNGYIEPADARTVLRCSVGLERLRMGANCDMDGNGRIEPADARAILRISVGLDGEDNGKNETETVRRFSSAVSRAELNENMDIFCNKIGSRWYKSDGMSRGKQKVISILKYNGYRDADIDIDGFYCNGVYAENVIASIPTSATLPDVVLFCAHYDSANTGTGAVDNASGVCAVLELSRIMKTMRVDFGFEVRFAFFACEEVGYCGAYRYINEYATYTRPRHSYVINVDMAGFSNKNNYNFLTVSTGLTGDVPSGSNRASKIIDRAKQLTGHCGEDNYYSGVSAGLHDLRPFKEYGLNAVTLSWRVKDDENPNYGEYYLAPSRYIHTGYDTMVHFNSDSLYMTTKLLAAAAAEIYLAE